MKIRKRIATIIAAGLVAVAGSLISAQPAAAADQTCPYPYVCFYKGMDGNGTISGKYQVVTSGWQWLGAAYGSDFVKNTRNDDVAYLHMSDGLVYCIAPHGYKSFDNDGPSRKVDAIRISWSSTC
jgi:Peptidase inhibitor family I36